MKICKYYLTQKLYKMIKTLNPEQIQILFLFCKQHYVNQYDLQEELVDHIASSIEEQWKQNPDLTFEHALNNTFSKFGITGFSKIKSQKELELRRKYRWHYWNYFLEFYKLPKIILTFVLTVTLCILILNIHNFIYKIIPYIILLIPFFIYYSIWIYPVKYKIRVKDNTPFMLVQQQKNYLQSSSFLLPLPIYIFNFFNSLENWYIYNFYLAFLLSFLVVSFSIALYANLTYIPKKIKEDFLKHYKEFAE